ncbi:aspartyl protease family protein [Asticcacaulis sp. DXS10W]|uniref:Aspartyl protease family protein n=1 Tax=Asticcacaulis currens TaxID=2984210 RepID=A0ABT5IC91_9CAUL|nr:aspartyl protease family protein [Asticcacaulis currens]MDC7693460.1 aspartyl protease family protein [Asticcacaulis currens]
MLNRRVIVLGGVASLAAPPSWGANTFTIPFAVASGRLIVKLSIGENPEVPFVLDTGASFMGIKEDLAALYKLPEVRQIQLKGITGASQSVNVFRCTNVNFDGGLPIKQVDMVGLRDAIAAGAISAALLTASKCTLSFEAQAIVLNGAAEPGPDYTKIAAKFIKESPAASRRIVIPVRVGQGWLNALIDTGSKPELQISQQAASRLKLLEAYPNFKTFTSKDTFGNAYTRKVIRVKDVSYGAAAFKETYVSVLDEQARLPAEFDAIIGFRHLHQFDYGFDGESFAYLKKNKHFVETTPLDTTLTP